MEREILALLLSGLGRDALKVGAALVLALVITLVFVISSIAALFGVIASPAAWPPSPGQNLNEIPPDQLPVMHAAAATCGLPWQILAAIARVESDFGANMATSSAGAIGYGQFLPSTWAAYGNGGNPYDYNDALPAMSRYLCASGAPDDLRRAIFAYNHADWYVDLVLEWAAHFGFTAERAASCVLCAAYRSGNVKSGARRLAGDGQGRVDTDSGEQGVYLSLERRHLWTRLTPSSTTC